MNKIKLNTKTVKTVNFGRLSINLLMVSLVLVTVLGCGASSGFKTKRERERERRTGTTRSTTAPAATTTPAADTSKTTADDKLATTLVNLSAHTAQYENTGNQTELRRTIADDFYYTNAKGINVGKQEYLDGISEDKTFVSVTVKDGRLIENDGSTATIEYTIITKTTGQTYTGSCRDTYVKRSENWMIKTFACSESVTADK